MKFRLHFHKIENSIKSFYELVGFCRFSHAGSPTEDTKITPGVVLFQFLIERTGPWFMRNLILMSRAGKILLSLTYGDDRISVICSVLCFWEFLLFCGRRVGLNWVIRLFKLCRKRLILLECWVISLIRFRGLIQQAFWHARNVQGKLEVKVLIL